MKKALPVLFLAFLAACGSGCATPYARQSLIGGYSETQLSENIFTVTFRGNGYTTRERASDFTLLRCAEIAINNGYNYFIIIDIEKYTTDMALTTPTTSYTTGYGHTSGSVNMYGSHGTFSGNTFGSAKTTTYGGQTFLISKPTTSNTILCMNEKSDGNPFVFDAVFLAKSVTKRYHLNRPVYATRVASAQNSAYPAQSTQESGREQAIVRNEPRQNVTARSNAPAQNQPNLLVKGIVWSPDRPAALIGDQIVREGGSVSGARVTKITKDTVEFEMNGITWQQGVSR